MFFISTVHPPSFAGTTSPIDVSKNALCKVSGGVVFGEDLPGVYVSHTRPVQGAARRNRGKEDFV